METCNAKGCSQPAAARGWCQMHHNRIKCAGRKRARKLYALGSCDRCGKPALDRHHKDDNAANNEAGNIAILCRSCHMAIDGRAERLAQASPVNKPKAPKPCSGCSRLYKPLRRSLCGRCYDRAYRPTRSRTCAS